MRFKSAAQRKAVMARMNKYKGYSYRGIKRVGINLSPSGDADKDGVKNAKDCRPLDVSRQDEDGSYQGWTNWDTWNTMLLLDNDERTSHWLDSWAVNFKKKQKNGSFDYDKAESVVSKYLIPVARGNKSHVTKTKLYPGQSDFVGDSEIDPKKVNKREIVDNILTREV